MKLRNFFDFTSAQILSFIFKANTYLTINGGVYQLVNCCGHALALWYGSRLVFNGELNGGDGEIFHFIFQDLILKQIVNVYVKVVTVFFALITGAGALGAGMPELSKISKGKVNEFVKYI